MNLAVSLWILNHLFLPFLVICGRKVYTGGLPILISSTAILYWTKPVTFDLRVYLEYFKAPHPFYEPFFC